MRNHLLFLSLCLISAFTCISQTNTPPKSGQHSYEGAYPDGSIYTYDGNFERHQFNGKGIFKTNGVEIEGAFVNGSLSTGTIVMSNTNQHIKFIGSFEMEENYPFKPDLIDGQKITTTSLGVITTCEYQNSKKIDCLSNNHNHYNQDHLNGPKKTAIDMHYFSDEYYLPIRVGTKSIDIKWDTGAYGLVVNAEDFSTLKKICDQNDDDDIYIEFTGIQQQSYSANGQGTLGEICVLNGLRMGEISVKSLIFVYDPGMTHSLLGMNFFEKFSNVKWDKASSQMVIFK
jgi:hypothetical protein